jgi:hypothetical protein
VAAYEQNLADLRSTAETERQTLQAVVDKQKGEIGVLASRVDTLSRVKVAMTDTINQLTTDKNAAYYIVGTRKELIAQGILVAEGPKHFLIVGSRPLVPARQLDPSHFTRIDRLTSRTIDLPEGKYEIMSRQNGLFAVPKDYKDGKIIGGLTIEQPEQFWESSKFLIIVRS